MPSTELQPQPHRFNPNRQTKQTLSPHFVTLTNRNVLWSRAGISICVLAWHIPVVSRRMWSGPKHLVHLAIYPSDFPVIPSASWSRATKRLRSRLKRPHDKARNRAPFGDCSFAEHDDLCKLTLCQHAYVDCGSNIVVTYHTNESGNRWKHDHCAIHSLIVMGCECCVWPFWVRVCLGSGQGQHILTLHMRRDRPLLTRCHRFWAVRAVILCASSNKHYSLVLSGKGEWSGVMLLWLNLFEHVQKKLILNWQCRILKWIKTNYNTNICLTHLTCVLTDS